MLSVLGVQVDGHGLGGQSHIRHQIGHQIEGNGAIAFVILPVEAFIDLDGVNGVFLGDGAADREEAQLLVNRVGRAIVVTLALEPWAGQVVLFPLSSFTSS